MTETERELRRLLVLEQAGELESIAVASLSEGGYRPHYSDTSGEYLVLLASLCMLRRRIENRIAYGETRPDDGPTLRPVQRPDHFKLP